MTSQFLGWGTSFLCGEMHRNMPSNGGMFVQVREMPKG